MRILDKIDYLKARYLNQSTLGGVKVTMFCPACKTRLHPWRYSEKYETLAEHVSDPNQAHKSKPVFKCLTETCPLFYTTGAFFDYEGSLYGGNLSREYQYAIGSMSYIVNKNLSRKRRYHR